MVGGYAGARVSDFLFTKNLNLNFFWRGGWGGLE